MAGCEILTTACLHDCVASGEETGHKEPDCVGEEGLLPSEFGADLLDFELGEGLLGLGLALGGGLEEVLDPLVLFLLA